MKRKGQAALEFLTTYGWALLVILVMIGALVYFGLLNPSKILPNKCTATTGFICKDFQVTQNSFSVVLTNKLGDTIKGVNFTSVPESDSFIAAPTFVQCSSDKQVVNADQDVTLTCNTPGVFSGVTDKVNIRIKANYTGSKQIYVKTIDVDLFAPVS